MGINMPNFLGRDVRTPNRRIHGTNEPPASGAVFIAMAVAASTNAQNFTIDLGAASDVCSAGARVGAHPPTRAGSAGSWLTRDILETKVR